MKTIQGFHFVYEVHKPESAKPGPGLEIARMTGDINAAGDMRSTVDATYGGLPVTVGIVALGDTYYVQDPISQKWMSVPAVDSPVGQLSLNAGTIRILDNITTLFPYTTLFRSPHNRPRGRRRGEGNRRSCRSRRHRELPNRHLDRG